MSGSSAEGKEFDDKPEFLEDKKWAKFKSIQSIHYTFDEICKTFEDEKKAEIWKSITTSIDPLSIELPVDKEFTPFQKLLLYSILCEDKLMS